MKRLFSSIIVVGLALSFVFLACEKKNDDTSIKPDYKANSGTGGNPNTGNVTTTGTVTTNPNQPQNNTTTTVGGAGWTFNSCGTTTANVITTTTIVAQKGSELVTLRFLVPPSAGTYNVSSSLLNVSSVMVSIQNASGQPVPDAWNGTGGTISVITSSNSVNVNFGTNGINCVRTCCAFPMVTIKGTMGCI